VPIVEGALRRDELALPLYRLHPIRDAAELKLPVIMAKNTRELGVDRGVGNGGGTTITATRRVVLRDQEHVLRHREGA
jgi:hypothetical protein